MKRAKKTLTQQLAARGDPFGRIGNLPPGQRIQRGRSGKITEDDPRWNPKTMGNRRGSKR